MNMKKALALTMATVLSVGTLAACGNSDASGDASTSGSAGSDVSAGTEAGVEKVNLKVWCPEEEMEMTQELADSFQAAHPEYEITWDIAVVGIDEAGNNLTTDADTAADVFHIPSGSVPELTEAGYLLPIGYDLDNIKNLYGQGAIESATREDMLYGIPYTPNSWFMYYNKSLYTEDEVKSLETMMAKDLGEDAYNFSCKISDAWYIEAFFYAAGAQLFGADGMEPTVCTWNDESGLAAGEYLIDLTSDAKYIEDKDGIGGSLFKEGKLGALCSGTWTYPEFKEALGDDLGAVALPTINVNGTDAHLSNFADYKLLAVKSNTAHPLAAQQFAQWLANEDAQLMRYKEAGAVPSCLSLQDNTELSSDVATIALLAQTEYATPQPAISQIAEYWTPAQALGEGIINGEITKANLQEKLDQCATAITTVTNAE